MSDERDENELVKSLQMMAMASAASRIPGHGLYVPVKGSELVSLITDRIYLENERMRVRWSAAESEKTCEHCGRLHLQPVLIARRAALDEIHRGLEVLCRSIPADATHVLEYTSFLGLVSCGDLGTADAYPYGVGTGMPMGCHAPRGMLGQ